MPWRRLSNGFFNPTGALFAVTAFSCSDGKFPLGARRKTGRAADAVPSVSIRRDLPRMGSELCLNVGLNP